MHAHPPQVARPVCATHGATTLVCHMGLEERFFMCARVDSDPHETPIPLSNCLVVRVGIFCRGDASASAEPTSASNPMLDTNTGSSDAVSDGDNKGMGDATGPMLDANAGCVRSVSDSGSIDAGDAVEPTRDTNTRGIDALFDVGDDAAVDLSILRSIADGTWP